MYSTASFTVVIFSASSSGTSMPKASSNAITSSTWSSESAPRSSTNDAVGVTSASSTPSCSTIICFTRSSTLAIPIPPRSLVALSVDLCLRFPGLLACTTRAEYSRAKIVHWGPSGQPAHLIYPAPQGQLSLTSPTPILWIARKLSFLLENNGGANTNTEISSHNEGISGG